MVRQMLLAYGSISLALGLFVIFESNRTKIRSMESAKINLSGTAASNKKKWEMRKISVDSSDTVYSIGVILTILGIVFNFFAVSS